MKSEFIAAINQICNERHLPQEVILEAIEAALVSAYRRNFGSGQNIKATIDADAGVPHVFLERIVVKDVEDDRFEISLAEAWKTVPDAELGMLVKTDVTPKSFGRIAAQMAKQVILQRIREAEREALYSSYSDREGELINGMVANITPQAVTLNLGRTEAIMPRVQQLRHERYRIGQRVRAYVMEVRRTNRGPQIIVSRAHRHMLRRLLELEVPEIFSGTVEIKGIAREAGSRSKVAVTALQDGVDPVGSCVGIRGMRIQSIVNELGGEKIDVVAWSPDTATFIANALSPAKVNYALLGEQGPDGRTATVVVPDDQLSLAIGKEGQNARLAAKLTGWRIDIKSRSESDSENLQPEGLMPALPSRQRDILAMAEAILLGKGPAPSPRKPDVVDEAAQTEPTPVQEQVAEVQVEPEAPEEAKELELSILTEADALLREQGAYPTSREEPRVEAGVPALAGEDTASKPKMQTVEETPAPESAAPEPKKTVKRSRYEYVEDKDLEVLKAPEKKARRDRRRQIFLDEETGQLISRRRHKGDDTAEEFEHDWND